jgi:CP family cyanate transporter-like MFS transporter
VTARVGLLAALAVMLVAFNLRGAFVAVSPVLDDVRADTGISAPVAGLLTTLPVLCFAVFSPLVPAAARRFGMDATLVAALVVLSAGIALRWLPSTVALFAGTAILGAAMAVGNVLLPSLIKRDFPRRIGLLTGLYVAAMSLGATIAAGTTVLLADATGLDWRATVALWAIPAVVALVAWLPQLRRNPRGGGPREAAVRGLWRDPIAWQVVGFMGMQSLIYYCITAWLPTLFTDTGLTSREAGFQLGVFNFIGLVGSLFAPILAVRARDQVRLVAVACALTAAGTAGVLAAPAAAPLVWMALLGAGQGATIGLALTLIGLRAPDAEHAAQLSGMVQSAGFLMAAVGPFAMGGIHDVAGSWTLAFALPAVALLPMTIAGLGAGRDRYVGARPLKHPAVAGVQ